MADSPLAPHAASAAELTERIEAERLGQAFLVYKEPAGRQHIYMLEDTAKRKITVGRAASCDVTLHWDEEVSGVHAELELIGDDWAVVDDGLSRNGTFVNGERVQGRRRLRTGDEVRFGKTVAAYRSPAEALAKTTLVAGPLAAAASLSDGQRRVLVALSEPFRQPRADSIPASDREIAEQLGMSADEVETHLKALLETFEIEDLPPDQERIRLVQCAFESGLIAESGA